MFKRNLFSLVDGPTTTAPRVAEPDEEALVQFVSFVLDDTQDTWTTLLAGSAHPYERAKLVLALA